eukprot:3578684-Rhodomonas_salina.1
MRKGKGKGRSRDVAVGLLEGLLLDGLARIQDLHRAMRCVRACACDAKRRGQRRRGEEGKKRRGREEEERERRGEEGKGEESKKAEQRNDQRQGEVKTGYGHGAAGERHCVASTEQETEEGGKREDRKVSRGAKMPQNSASS